MTRRGFKSSNDSTSASNTKSVSTFFFYETFWSQNLILLPHMWLLVSLNSSIKKHSKGSENTFLQSASFYINDGGGGGSLMKISSTKAGTVSASVFVLCFSNLTWKFSCRNSDVTTGEPIRSWQHWSTRNRTSPTETDELNLKLFDNYD